MDDLTFAAYLSFYLMLSHHGYCLMSIDIVQRLDIRHRPFRHHEFLIRLSPAPRSQVSVFTNPKVDRVLESVPIDDFASVPIQIPQPPTQPRVVVPYHFQIAHEDGIVGDIEPDERHIQPDIRIGDVLAKQVRLTARFPEVPFQAVERLEERIQARFVRVLRRREARLVDAVVDRVVDPAVHGVNVRAQPLRVEPAARRAIFAQVLREQRVEGDVEHADDLAALVVHHGFRLLVPEDRHRVPALVLRVGLFVQVLHPGEAVEGVRCVGAVAAGEAPALLGELAVADDELDDGFEALEGADEVGAVGPGAAVVEVEGVAVFLGRECRVGRRGDEVAESAGLPTELTICGGVLVDWWCLERRLAMVSLGVGRFRHFQTC